MLEVGCGEGGILAQLDQISVREGIDWSEERLAVARRRNPESVKLVQGDVTLLDTFYTQRQFDAVICFDVLEHFKKRMSDKVLGMVEAVASRFVVVWGPLGEEGMTKFKPVSGVDTKGMDHLCILEEIDFAWRGYFTMIFPSYWINWPADALLAIKKVGA